jgi:hypothetical protein
VLPQMFIDDNGAHSTISLLPLETTIKISRRNLALGVLF